MRLGIGLGFGFQNRVAQVAAQGEEMPTNYLFIDAANLNARVKYISERYCNGAKLELDWHQVGGGFDKIFYYDALPGRKRQETDDDFEGRFAEADQLHKMLQTFDRYRVYQGDARWRSGRGHEQKKVDVMITVDMLKHTIRRNMDKAALLASDVDFRPLLDALVDEGMFVTLIYAPGSTSDELLGAADARKPMTVRQIYEWLTPASRKTLGFVSPSSITNARQGKRITSWTDPKRGLIEIGERDDSQGGFGEGTVWMHWQHSGNDWHYFQADDERILRLVAEDDFGIVELP